MTVNAILKAKGDTVVVVGPEESVQATAALLAARRIGAVLVVGGQGEILGILSERDIVRGLAEQGAAVLAQPVHSLMTGEVLRCARGDTVADLMGLMTARRIRHLPVIVGERLVGLLCERDLLLSAVRGPDGSVFVVHGVVGAAMVRAPLSCSSETSVATVAQLMIDHKLNAMPVVDDDARLRGIVTSTDLMWLLVADGRPTVGEGARSDDDAVAAP